ncbi:MAG: hypothetical protein J6L91_00765 [Clostridia bacterium]|nr:hypothetical protein [Clostridia bacterium]
MKKRFIIIPILITVIFVLCLFFGKDLANAVLLKETAVSYTAEEEKTVTLKKGDYVILGKHLGEPIVWLVVDVDEGRPLLQTKHIIDFKAFDAAGDGDSDTKALGSSDFDTSTLKLWLNSEDKVRYISSAPADDFVLGGKNAYADEKGFLCSDNFTPEEKNLFDAEGIFLLSKEQISSLLPKELRAKTATKSALLKDESSYIFTSGKGIWYWTASPVSSNRTSVATVTSAGGFYKASAFDGVTGVCPAVYLKEQRCVAVWGNASEDKPFVITEVSR